MIYFSFTMPTYKLTYFDVKGIGEPLRLLLSYGGVSFEDVRITFEQWPSVKPSNYNFYCLFLMTF